MLSDNFDNHCAFCRAQIIDQSDLQKSPDPIVVLQLYYFENFVLDMEGKNNRKQELLELFDRYLTVIKGVGYTPSEMFSEARVVMIWEEFLAMVYEEERQRLRLREARRERERRDTAEAALRLERQQEMDRQRSKMLRILIPVMARFAGVVIASRLGLW